LTQLNYYHLALALTFFGPRATSAPGFGFGRPRGGAPQPQPQPQPCTVHQGAPKKKKEKSDVPTYLPFLRFFLRFSGLILENSFMVFLSSSCRETAKNAIKESDGKKRKEKSFFSQLFRPKAFAMLDFPQKVFAGVFELPLLRNAQNATKKISEV
jgi:hypothetical protein